MVKSVKSRELCAGAFCKSHLEFAAVQRKHSFVRPFNKQLFERRPSVEPHAGPHQEAEGGESDPGLYSLGRSQSGGRRPRKDNDRRTLQ